MDILQLERAIEAHFAAGAAASSDPAAMAAFLELRDALEKGEIRSASPDPQAATGWRVNAWVKKGILLGFRLGALHDLVAAGLSFVDKHTYPVRMFTAEDGVRVGFGSAILRHLPSARVPSSCRV